MPKTIPQTLFCCLSFFTYTILLGQSVPIHFQSTDGFKLHGEYYTVGKKAPGVLMIHMCNVGDRTHYKELAQMLSQDFNVLLFDFRGHGESRTTKYDVIEDKDVFWNIENNMIAQDIKAAYEQLISKPQVNPKSIALIGASCTVDRTIQLASNHMNIKAMVLLSGNAHKRSLDHIKTSDSAIYGIAALDDGDGIAAKWIEEILLASSNKQNEKRIYETGGHGTELLTTQKKLKKEISEWLIHLLYDTN